MTDGCTLAPDLSAAVYACCAAHDVAYGIGGSIAQWIGANITLGACLAVSDHPLVALPYALATILFGWIFWPWRKKGKGTPTPTTAGSDKRNPPEAGDTSGG